MKAISTTRTTLIVLSSYILLQLLWWAYIILNLQDDVYAAEQLQSKRWMILGEGMVFLSLLLFGFIRLNRAIVKELQLSRQQQNFLLSVTHEIKTPLTALKLSLQTLRKRQSENFSGEILGHALKEQKRLEHFVDDIFAVNALEDRRWNENKKNLNVSALLHSIVENLQLVYPANHLHINCPDTLELVSDEKALYIILSNTIENACKYSPFCASVWVEVSEDKNHVLFQVKDEGEGINESERKRIFDKFYRLGDEKQRKSKGSGLGLYLVKSFTQYLKGRIALESNSPKGSNFKIYIPK